MRIGPCTISPGGAFMRLYTVAFQPSHVTVQVEPGTTLLQAQIAAGLRPDAPCGGKGVCGKCKVSINGQKVLSCRTPVDRDMRVWTEEERKANILTHGRSVKTQPDGTDDQVLAFDIGTTTVVAYLLNGITGEQIASASCMNPQTQYGADVISRIQCALDGSGEVLSACIRNALTELSWDVAARAGISVRDITTAAIVGNTAMHHLLLGIDPKPLITPPYMPRVLDALELGEECKIRILPNIAGFVGGDTVGCMVSTRFDQLEEMTLLIDIGTNGEMVLGSKYRRIACSTAAGPAFEGAGISCGMRGVVGAIDHVWLEDGRVSYHVIGEGDAIGLCGSGLLDLIAVLLELGIIDASGYLEGGKYRLCNTVTLTQRDVREVQLAKAAIRTGIELLAEKLETSVEKIKKVLLAGAFGNYMTPASACRIGMIPPCLEKCIVPIGNAAGEGAILCAVNAEEFIYSQKLASGTEFLELATAADFQDRYIDSLEFAEVQQ